MWLDRAVKWLLPREEHFFDLLERGASCSYKGSTLLSACCKAPSHTEREPIVDTIRDVEHEADKIVAEVYEALNKTFVTPMDRSDIFALATALENITDDIFATSLQFIVHAMEDLPAGSSELAALVEQACADIDAAVALLRDLKKPEDIRTRCQALKQLESDGDRVFRTHLGMMFKTETDAIRLLKHKEFLEGLEETLDACDDVGNVLETIVIKNA